VLKGVKNIKPTRRYLVIESNGLENKCMCVHSFLSWFLEQKHMPKILGFFAFYSAGCTRRYKDSSPLGLGFACLIK
jgi:hypothetical protein